jgi:flagellar FliL protein
MAKKEKAPKTEEETSAPEGDAQGADAAPKKGLGKIFGALKSKKVLLIALPALLLVLGGGGAGAYFFLFKHDAKKEAKADDIPLTPPQVAFIDVDKLTANIQGADAATPEYLQLSVTLEMENDAQKTGVTALMPRVKDQFQAYLRELRLEDLKGSEGSMRLKEELLRRVNVAAAPYKVRDVLLKDMIEQ